MIYTYAYEIDEEHTAQGLIDIAKKYRTLCDIATNKQPKYMFIKFEGDSLDDIADLFDKEAEYAGYEASAFMEVYS